MKYEVKELDADVLVIGGGISGSLAAIKAAEEGLNVVVLEKSNTKRSGNAGSGIDHIFSYIPEFHKKVGYSMEQMKEEQNQLNMANRGLGFRELNDFFVEHSYDRVMQLEKYGLKFRFEDSQYPGKYRIVPQFHSVPTSFNFEGRDIKPVLTKEMEHAGVNILNRVFVYELLKASQQVIGAIGVSTRENIIYVVKAYTTILATAGGVDRLAKTATGADFERFHAASMNNGGGKVLAMEAGADVINLEYTLAQGEVGWHNWSMSAGSPGGTYWPCARIVNAEGEIILERSEAYDVNDSDYVEKYMQQSKYYEEGRMAAWKRVQQGEQLYLDFSAATDEEIEYIKWSLSHEGKCNVLLANMEENGIDFKKNRIPFKYTDLVQTYVSCSGVYANVKCETTVENLYAAGNEIAGMSNNSAPEAVVYGIEAGLQAAERAKKLKAATTKLRIDKTQVEKIRRMVESFYENQNGNGDEWLDIEHAVQDVVNSFGTTPHTDKKSEVAVQILDQMEREMRLKASNPHEVGRCLDVLFILKTARAIFLACERRKENFGPFIKEVGGKDSYVSPEQTEIYGIYRDGNIYRFHTIAGA